MKTWHKVGFVITAILAIASWVIALYYWGKLPSVIPTHFGISGQPDAWQDKSLFWAFMLPLLQLLLVAGFGFLYWKPQYSDMPTTLWLTTLSEKTKEHAFALIRTMLVGTALWVSVLLSYMVYMMNEAALKTGVGMDPWILLVVVSGMIIWLIWWTIKVYKATREAIKKEA